MSTSTERLTVPARHHRLVVLNTGDGISRTRKRARILLVAAGILVHCLGCKPDPVEVERQTNDHLRVAATRLAGSTSLFVAEARGFFKEEGLTVTVSTHDSGQQAMSLMLAGGADLATVGDTPFALATLEEKPVSVVACVCNNSFGNALLARRDRNISEAKDLTGKKVGRVPWTTADFFLHIYLTTSQISPAGVRVVDLEPSQVPEALMDGQVDAVATWTPNSITIADKLGTNVVVMQDPTIYTMAWLVVARPAWATAEPRSLRKFLRALIRANEYLLAHPEEGRATYANRAAITPVLAASALRGWDFSVTLDQSLVLGLEDQARWILKKRGLGRTPPNFLNHIHAEGLKTVAPELVTIPGK